MDKIDIAAIESSVRRWYDQRIKPALQAAVSNDAALERGLREYRRWLRARSYAALVALNDVLSESQSLAAAALSDAIARANDLCEQQESFAEAEKALTWLLRAEGVLPESVLAANQLDRDTVRADLCLQVVFESTSFPQAPVIGQAATLSGVVGYAFGGGATQFAAGMDAGIEATGASPANSIVMMNASGEFEQTLTPMDPGVTIEINACIGNVAGSGPATGSLVCQDAFIVRGLVIDPAEAALEPAGTQSFAALLGGQPTDVDWTATGGTIDGNGLYTAGTNTGEFTVTATSVADSSLRASATVTIDDNTTDDSRFRGVWQGTVTQTVTTTGKVETCEDLSPANPDSCVLFNFATPGSFTFVPDSIEACILSQAACANKTYFGGEFSGDTFVGDVTRTRAAGTIFEIAPGCNTISLERSDAPDGTPQLRGSMPMGTIFNPCSASGRIRTSVFALECVDGACLQ